MEHEKLSKQMMLLRRLLPSPSSSPPRSPWDSLRDFQRIIPKVVRALGETERPVSHELCRREMNTQDWHGEVSALLSATEGFESGA